MALSIRPRRDRGDDFYAWAGRRPVTEIDGFRLRGPVFYHRADAFVSLHLASYDAVREVLPSAQLYPVRWFDGRAVIGIGAFCYHHVSLEHADGTPHLMAPYGEIGVLAMVSRQEQRPGVPVLRSALKGTSGFVLDLPVTTAEARDGGRQLFGLPKFVADMDFHDEPTLKSVRLSEAGSEILTLTVRPRGPVSADRGPFTLYSVLDGRLLETTAPFQGHRQVRLGRNSGALVLGDHPVAARLRGLSVTPTALLTASYLDARLILPLGDPVGDAREYQGYLGGDQDRGRLTVSYPGTPPIDLYAVPPGLPVRGPAAPAGTGATV